MSLFQPYRWFLRAAAITAAFASVSLLAHKSAALTAFGDVAALMVMLTAAGVTLANAVARPRPERGFWTLMTFGFALWATNLAGWTYRECVLGQPIPDPFFFDIILFFHTVPMIAAVAWRPDVLKKEGRVLLSFVQFVMLLGWWIFLYAFIVFPHQYVVLNVATYNYYFDRLYSVENGVLLAVVALAVFTSSGGWRRLYIHFLGAYGLYAINSQFLARAATNGSYFSGSLSDVPLIGAVAWLAAAAWSARGWRLHSVPYQMHPRWKKLIPRLAMLAVLSLPVLGLWTAWLDRSGDTSRMFRIAAVLAAMLSLGAFVFLRQYLQDQALIGLLQDSRQRYETQKQLQSQLVQKEKLASLGTLVAGAAHEIDLPLKAIMAHSQQLSAHERLTDEQNTLLRKIVSHAQRTRDLVANLLSFARQAPGEKALADLKLVLNRAAHAMESRCARGQIRIELVIAPDLPRIWGNMNQLFQVSIEIVENAIEALHEARGGWLKVTATHQGADVVVEFSDSGPGIRDPQRVFDPFYTTKPVGKGTGLGLSAVYGVVQDHGGHISCQNKPEGGALFVLRFPAAAEPTAQGAGAAGH